MVRCCEKSEAVIVAGLYEVHFLEVGYIICIVDNVVAVDVRPVQAQFVLYFASRWLRG